MAILASDKSEMGKRYVEGLDCKLNLLYLPPYLPDLNVDETVWTHVKTKVSHHLVEGAEKMKRLAIGVLQSN